MKKLAKFIIKGEVVEVFDNQSSLIVRHKESDKEFSLINGKYTKEDIRVLEMNYTELIYKPELGSQLSALLQKNKCEYYL